MKIFAISDLHLSTAVDKPMEVFGQKWDNYVQIFCDDWKNKVSDDDIVLLPGDLSWAMRACEAKSDFDLLGTLKGKKIILRGNHDYWWNTLSQVKSILPANFYPLQNNAYKFDDIVICGTRGWVCPDSMISEEDEKIYLREVQRFGLSLQKMRQLKSSGDKVVCMFHFPPFNVKREPCEFIKLMIENNIEHVVYGHLHGKDSKAELFFNKFNIDFHLVSTDLIGHKLKQIF